MKRLILLTFLMIVSVVPLLAQTPVRRIDFYEKTSLDNGTIPITTVTTDEYKGILHKTTITLTNVPVSLVDANVGGGTKIYTFSEGRIMILGAVAVGITPTTTSTIASTLNSGVTLSTGVGSVQTTTQNSGTLATTQQDIIAQFSTTSSTTINVAGTGANGKLASSAQFDGTTTAQAVYLNFGVPTATDIDADATITVSGTIIITWINLGDY